jgi:HK97 family phage major capsid protein
MNAISPVSASAPHGIALRFMSVGVEAGANDVLRATLCSETPVECEFGDEILVHTPEAVDLSRAAMGLPLLIDHDPDRQLGRVENIRLEGRKLVGDIRLTERADMMGIVADVRSGIRPDISIGYFIHDAQPDQAGTAYRVTKWTLYEVSSVALPADHTVGIGRSLHSRKVFPMNAITTGAPASDEKNQSPAVRAERERINNIRTLATRLNCAELGERAIREGHDIDTFSAIYAERAGAPVFRAAEVSADAQFDRETRQFSLSAALAGAVSGRMEGREAEISKELAKRSGRSPQGFFMPIEALSKRNYQIAGNASAGGNLIGTDYRPDLYIDPFRASAQVVALGATVITDLVGNVAIPRQDDKVSGTWVAENVAASYPTLNFSQVALSPKTVTAIMRWSRQMALQGLPAMEDILRKELSEQLGLALDKAAVSGAGTATEPKGILNVSGVGSVAGGANGAAPTWDNIVGLESAIVSVDAGETSRGYLTNGLVRGKLKRTQKFASTNGESIWGSDGRLNGYRAEISSHVPSNLTKGTSNGVCSAIIFGDWSEVIIGMWSGIDILVDPYYHSETGAVRISAFLSADIGVKHPAAFAAMLDALHA